MTYIATRRILFSKYNKRGPLGYRPALWVSYKTGPFPSRPVWCHGLSIEHTFLDASAGSLKPRDTFFSFGCGNLSLPHNPDPLPNIHSLHLIQKAL